MANIQLNQGEVISEYMTNMSNFLAILEGDNVNINGFLNQVPTGVEALDAKVDEEMFRVALALSPMDAESEAQNQILPTDLQMIHDLIGSDDMQMDSNAGTGQVSTSSHYPDSSPQLYDLSYGYSPQQQHNAPEVLQTVPVHNMSVMLSGAIPQPQPLPQPLPQPQPQPMTIDPSQILENPLSQAVSVDPSESMSVDPSEVDGSVTAKSMTHSMEMGGAEKGEEEPMARPPRTDEPPKLPDFKELLVRIRYRSQEVAKKHMKNPNGCLVYHKKPWNFQALPEHCPDGMEFPGITVEERAKMTDGQFKFTEQVLNALEKGLFLECDNYGNVYATRYCRSKIFWYSTEQGPIADAQITQRQLPSLKFQKLERNEKVMVFDNMLFQRKLLHFVVNKPTFKNEASNAAPNKHCIPISPAIFFTFAQSWNPMNSALSSCLVSMVVNPVRARMQRQWGNEDRHESYDLSNYHPQISAPSDTGEKS